MNRSYIHILRKLLLIASAFTVLALPDALGEGRAITAIQAPRRIDLLMIGGICDLELKFSSSDASAGDVTFSVTKAKQAAISVDEAGRITPLKPGKATLTIKAKSGAGSAKCEVRVLSDQDAAKEVLGLVNEARKKAKLKPLKLDEKLCKAAAVRAAELEELCSHTRPDGRPAFTAFDEQKLNYSYKAENIAAGQTTPEQVTNNWLNSQGHRENILYPKFTHMGLGIIKTQSGRICWAQLFGGK